MVINPPERLKRKISCGEKCPENKEEQGEDLKDKQKSRYQADNKPFYIKVEFWGKGFG